MFNSDPDDSSGQELSWLVSTAIFKKFQQKVRFSSRCETTIKEIYQMGYHATQTLNQNLFIVWSCQWPEPIIKFIWEEPTQCKKLLELFSSEEKGLGNLRLFISLEKLKWMEFTQINHSSNNPRTMIFC